MKLYLLKTKEWGYDCYDSMLIRAESEQRAREIANENCADEGAIWTDKKITSCEIIFVKGIEQLIISSFNAG